MAKSIEQTITELQTKLTAKMLEFLEETDDERQALGWVGDNADWLMAKAAMTTLEASAQVQSHLIKEGMLEAVLD